jgi:hypothetical protein
VVAPAGSVAPFSGSGPRHPRYLDLDPSAPQFARDYNDPYVTTSNAGFTSGFGVAGSEISGRQNVDASINLLKQSVQESPPLI